MRQENTRVYRKYIIWQGLRKDFDQHDIIIIYTKRS